VTEHNDSAAIEVLAGRPVLRFERRYDTSASKLWRAVSDPAELARWFPSAITWTPKPGETIVIDDLAGVIGELENESRIEFTVRPEYYRFEVRETPSGATLVFVHGFDVEVATAAQFGSGWEAYLQRLEAHLAGEFLTEEDAHAKSTSRLAFYEERFGKPKSVGVHP
jgi:uncharacterized protein YndB with AHSA1/START domain